MCIRDSIWTAPTDSPFLHDAFVYRLNYVVFHYLFIFMFGAFMAEHFQQAVDWISRRGVFINVLQLAEMCIRDR